MIIRELLRRHNESKSSVVVFTYFIQCGEGGPIKIGLSQKPEERLRTLQTASPNTLTLLLAIHGDHERALHKRFGNLRISGEWFTPSRELVEFIAQLAWMAAEINEIDERLPSGDLAMLEEKLDGIICYANQMAEYADSSRAKSDAKKIAAKARIAMQCLYSEVAEQRMRKVCVMRSKVSDLLYSGEEPE